jgi:PadR family transcriptional regulator AphA
MSVSPVGLEEVFLGLLYRHPTHAYELFHLVSQETDLKMIWRLKESHVYAILNKLEHEHLLVGEVISQGTRPPRRILHLTSDGEQRFVVWRRTPVYRARAFRQEFLAKLYFAFNEGAESTEELLNQQIQACNQRVIELQHDMDSFTPNRNYAHAVIQFRITQMEAILSWLHMLSSSLLPTSS